MRATRTASLLAAAMLGLLAASPSRAESCFAYKEACEAVCTPDRVARYYAGSERRCSASCTPRFSQCMRTGWWADLERLSSGDWEKASRF